MEWSQIHEAEKQSTDRFVVSCGSTYSCSVSPMLCLHCVLSVSSCGTPGVDEHLVQIGVAIRHLHIEIAALEIEAPAARLLQAERPVTADNLSDGGGFATRDGLRKIDREDIVSS